MYFWKTENLKEDIKTKRLTEKDRFIYMFITLIIAYYIINIAILTPSKSPSTLGIVFILSDTFIVLLGTFLAFRSNGGAMGVDFLGKYFSIGFVVSLRSIPLFIPIIIIIALIDAFFPVINTKEIKITPIVEILLLLIWEIFICWKIIKHIKDVKEI